MSIFGKTPYIEAKLSALSDEQKSALATVINSSADNATVYSLTDLRALSVDTIGAVKIQFNPACLRAGYLVLKYNSFCTFITNELYYKGNATVIDIDLANLKYKEIKEDCTVEEIRRILGSSGGSTGGNTFQVETTKTVSSWDVPDLTVEQVTAIYNCLVAGESVTVQSADGDVQFKAVLGDATTDRPSIVIQYYWLGWVDYQIAVGGTTLDVTAHKIPEAQAHSITSVTVGTDTIDLVIS